MCVIHHVLEKLNDYLISVHPSQMFSSLKMTHGASLLCPYFCVSVDLQGGSHISFLCVFEFQFLITSVIGTSHHAEHTGC